MAFIIRHYPNLFDRKGKDIVCALRNKRINDERTGVDAPLVYQLSDLLALLGS